MHLKEARAKLARLVSGLANRECGTESANGGWHQCGVSTPTSPRRRGPMT